MIPIRTTLTVLALGGAVLAVALALSEGVRDFAASTGLLTWIVIAGLVALGVWATRRLPPKASRDGASPPGVQWFPTGTWWGHRRRRE